MVPLKTALVVGGGFAGMSAAITLRRLGIAVTLIDLDPDWRVYGAGITITGPTLRAMKALGVLDEIMAAGHTADGLRVSAVDGTILEEIATPDPTGSGVPGAGGILRPVLHGILSRHVRSLGAEVRLGLTVSALQSHEDSVAVTFSDGSSGRYDLLVGADGLFSTVRGLLFPDAPQPRYTGQICWRLMLARPPTIDRRHYFLGGPVKIGFTPVSATEMYMFLLERAAENTRPADADLHRLLAALMEGYGGAVYAARRGLSPASRIIRRPLEAILLPAPWHTGRAVVIGDAVHATTPQLASGAGMAIEDGLVLGEEIAAAPTLGAALQRFMVRRLPRCRLVVENSLELGEIEMKRGSVAEHTALMARSLEALAQPY